MHLPICKEKKNKQTNRTSVQWNRFIDEIKLVVEQNAHINAHETMNEWIEWFGLIKSPENNSVWYKTMINKIHRTLCCYKL